MLNGRISHLHFSDFLCIFKTLSRFMNFASKFPILFYRLHIVHTQLTFACICIQVKYFFGNTLVLMEQISEWRTLDRHCCKLEMEQAVNWMGPEQWTYLSGFLCLTTYAAIRKFHNCCVNTAGTRGGPQAPAIERWPKGAETQLLERKKTF